MRVKPRTLAIAAFLMGAVLLWLPAAAGADEPWIALGQGLELARFKTHRATVVSDSVVTVLRADPAHWDVRLYCASEDGAGDWRNARECADEHGLAVATNAGMFAADHLTHVGYLRSGEHVNSAGVNHYLSVAAFGPLRMDYDALGNPQADTPLFRIFDLGAQGASVSSIREGYSNVIQNLRLIKRPGINRWSQQEKMWSEAALGEDSQGRVLFIFCRSPYSMHDLNEILLALPIDLVCAQHLEGGPEAQLIVRSGETELELVGSYETGFNENDDNQRLWRIPNVIGVRARER